MNASIDTVTRQVSFWRDNSSYRSRNGGRVPVPVMPSFQRVVESCACPMLIISSVAQAQPIVYASPAFLELSGYSLEEMAGREWTRIFASDSSNSQLEAVRAAIGRGGRDQAVLAAQHRNGTKLHLDVKVTPLPDDAGAVSHCVAVVSDVTAEYRRREVLEYRAYHDQLTGLANRHLLQDRFDQALAHARRSNTGLVLAILDLNGFKQVNDRFGHEAGDALLRLVSARLKSAVRDGDTVARLGGDEFVLLMPESEPLESAELIVARVCASLTRPIQLRNARVQVSCCAGVAVFPDDGVDLDSILRAADARLYRAKDANKQRRME
ncbi:MAG TPA: sensor domain-containing diguanylate cyclase [Steroidobacteraceae bacterium]